MADDRAISRREGERRGGVPGNPGVYYFAADGGGVWKTTDGGTVWKPIFDQEPVASIGALTLAPSECEHHLRWNGCEYDFCRQQLWRWNLQIP